MPGMWSWRRNQKWRVHGAALRQDWDEVPMLWPPLGTIGDAETGHGLEASCRSGGKVPFELCSSSGCQTE
eukprot:2539298-Rhodomonas_salina.1